MKDYRVKLRKNTSKFKRYFSIREFKKIGFFKTIARLTLAGLIVVLLLFVWYSKDLPTPAKINKRINKGSTQILDRNGELLYAISGDKKRLVVPLSDIPNYAKQATIAIEDKHFYKHFGVDFNGLIRGTILKPLTGHRAQGGSTLTQQFVKNALLNPKRSVSRKIKEAILAVELEMFYSKDKILELYLNEIPYGSTAYGIDAASRLYFGKPAKELLLSEAAVLAALPQAPTYYSPYGPNKQKLLERKNYILDLMAEQNYISKAEAEDAKKLEISFQSRKDSIVAPHFVFYVQQLIADKYGEEQLQNGSLRITTTLDLKTQKMAVEAIEEGSKKLDRYGANNAALVSVEPNSGEILAMVGSRDYFNEDIQGQVNVTTSLRQPGSSFKPIVYVTAFKQKYNPAFPLFDLKTDFGGGYSPNNYDGATRGLVSMRTALSNSLNIPAVKTLALVGVNNALKTAKDLGITSLNEPDRYGLALVLGGGEVQPLEMAGAFATFANSGKHNPTQAILKVETADGKILEEYREHPDKQALDPQAAYLVTDVLSDSNARRLVFGFTNNLTLPDRPVAVKTGTTQDFHDAWTVGYTPQISTAVWVGNTNNDAMKSGADGSVVAAPIWNAYMKKYHEGKEVKSFVRPAEIKEIFVDFLSNKIPSAESPEGDKRLDVFASWNAPTTKDDIHIKVRVNKVNGKIATDHTPKELIEDRLYTNIHSEMPDNPNWENPVLAWANSIGINNLPPKENDDMYTLQDYPAISISTPKNNQNITDTIDITVLAQSKYGIKKVDFKIGSKDLGSATVSPYKISVDTSILPKGSQKISVIAWDVNGASSTANVTVNIIEDTTGPGVSKLVLSVTSSTASLTWNTDELAKSYVEYSTNQKLNSKSIEENIYSLAHSLSLGGLSSKTKYYYRIVSTDKDGNKSTSKIDSFTTK